MPQEQPEGEKPQVVPPENAAQNPPSEIIDERTPELKEQIARDPASTDETVVLPVENGLPFSIATKMLTISAVNNRGKSAANCGAAACDRGAEAAAPS